MVRPPYSQHSLATVERGSDLRGRLSVNPSHTCQSPVCQALGWELGWIRETVLGTGDVSKGFLPKNRNVCVCVKLL